MALFVVVVVMAVLCVPLSRFLFFESARISFESMGKQSDSHVGYLLYAFDLN